MLELYFALSAICLPFPPPTRKVIWFTRLLAIVFIVQFIFISCWCFYGFNKYICYVIKGQSIRINVQYIFGATIIKNDAAHDIGCSGSIC